MLRGLFAIVAALSFLTQNANALKLVTDRPAEPIAELLLAFEQQTGHKVDFVSMESDPLVASLISAEMIGDVVLMKDLEYLSQLQQANQLQRLPAFLLSQVSPSKQDNRGEWMGITYRARSIVFHPDRVEAQNVTRYEDLARPEFAGRLCLRKKSSSYTRSMVSFLVAQFGVEKAEQIVSGWVKNVGEKYYTSDTQILRAMAAGECDASIVNSYYLAALYNREPEFPVQLSMVEQNQGGVHTNGLAVGIMTSSTEQTVASELIQFLLSNFAQIFITNRQFDFPIRADLAPWTPAKRWENFIQSDLSWSEIGSKSEIALDLLNRVGHL